MSRFEQVTTEYASGSIKEMDYGSRVRIVMRSEEHVMFVAYGVNYIVREERNTPRDSKVASSSKKAYFEDDKVRAKIVKIFGEGADSQAILAISTRGKGTILVDGGGEPLPLPNADLNRINELAYDKVTPDQTFEPQHGKRCVQCDKALKLSTDHHRLSPTITENHPKTAEQCQLLTNKQIVRVSGFGRSDPQEKWPYIKYFETWDGESYINHVFCSDKCAAVYGRRAYAEGVELEAGGEVPPSPAYRKREDQDHYDVEAEKERQRLDHETYWKNR